MRNILEAAIKEALECSPAGVSGNEFRLQALLKRLGQELPEDEAYLEVGAGDGGYFEAALESRKDLIALAAVTPTEISSGSSATFKGLVAASAKKYPSCQFFDGDFLKYMGRRGHPFPNPVGIYFYDGARMQCSLRAAAGRARAFLAQQSILLFGHWNQTEVQIGTWEGITRLRPTRLVFQELSVATHEDLEGFGDGLGAFHLEHSSR
jgi:hypothetical protein